MLGSITPLGERGRGSRWWLTATAYVVGSVVGGVAMGALMGAIGAGRVPLDRPDGAASSCSPSRSARGCSWTSASSGSRCRRCTGRSTKPGARGYRGWVWGLGFGLQLGTGVVTIVTTSAVYATLARGRADRRRADAARSSASSSACRARCPSSRWPACVGPTSCSAWTRSSRGWPSRPVVSRAPRDRRSRPSRWSERSGGEARGARAGPRGRPRLGSPHVDARAAAPGREPAGDPARELPPPAHEGHVRRGGGRGPRTRATWSPRSSSSNRRRPAPACTRTRACLACGPATSIPVPCRAADRAAPGSSASSRRTVERSASTCSRGTGPGVPASLRQLEEVLRTLTVAAP